MENSFRIPITFTKTIDHMKSSSILLSVLFFLFLSGPISAQQKGVTATNKGAAVSNGKGGGVEIKKKEAAVTSSKGGGAAVNNKGAEAKNKNGAGVEVHKHQVSAENSHGHGVEANKKGLDVKGSKGGMTVEKKHLQIKGKGVNINLGH